jgi:hypothetical protein
MRSLDSIIAAISIISLQNERSIKRELVPQVGLSPLFVVISPQITAVGALFARAAPKW